MHDSFNEVAFAGCSCKNNLPSNICLEYSLQIHAKCTQPNFLGSRFVLLMNCQVLNVVHMGEPTNRVGF